MILTLTELADLIRYGKAKKVSQARDDIIKILPCEITFNGEVICKVVPKTWRSHQFPVH